MKAPACVQKKCRPLNNLFSFIFILLDFRLGPFASRACVPRTLHTSLTNWILRFLNQSYKPGSNFWSCRIEIIFDKFSLEPQVSFSKAVYFVIIYKLMEFCILRNFGSYSRNYLQYKIWFSYPITVLFPVLC